MNTTSNVQPTNFQFFSAFSQCPYKRHIQEIIDYSLMTYYSLSFEETIISLLTLIILYQQFFYGRRLQKLENMLKEDEDSEDEDSEEEDSEEEDSEEEDDDLSELFATFQETAENSFKSFNKKLKTLQDNLARVENDLSDDNNENDQKFKIMNKKLSKLNEKYSSLEVMVDELNDSDTDVDDSDDSDYEHEQEKEKDKKRTYGSIRIQNYNDKSFAVFGDTKEFKEVLKQLGGKWNRKLSGGPGWIFSNNYRDDVNKWFHSHFDEDNL
jgi:hypothetical protein